MTPRPSLTSLALVVGSLALLPSCGSSTPKKANRNATSVVASSVATGSIGDTTIAFGDSTLVFAPLDQARSLETENDAFKQQLSALDRQILGRTANPVSVAELDAKLATIPLEWTVNEKTQQADSAKRALVLMKKAGLTYKLPKVINLVKNDPALYSGSPYTRGTTIFTPIVLDPSTLVHELWHIVSRANHVKLAPIYALVGYVPCSIPRKTIGADLTDVVLTNPDTEVFGDYCVTFKNAAGKMTTYTPLLYGNAPYTGQPSDFGRIIDPALAVVDTNKHAVVVNGGKTETVQMYEPPTITEYAKAIGGNGLNEAFHPDEIIASTLGTHIRALESQDAASAEKEGGNTNPPLVERLVAAVSRFP
jgi:hypothetical protein